MSGQVVARCDSERSRFKNSYPRTASSFIYKAIEIGGECIENMSVSGRLVLAN